MNELGFTQAPRKKWIYIGNISDTECRYPWYFLEDSSKKIGINYEGIRCVIKHIEIKQTEYKGKIEHKFDITVEGDRHYTIRSGVKSNFVRGLVLSLNKLIENKTFNFNEPVTICVVRGAENTVFCNLYDNFNQFVKKDWDDTVKLLPLIYKIQKMLGISEPNDINDMKYNEGKR